MESYDSQKKKRNKYTHRYSPILVGCGELVMELFETLRHFRVHYVEESTNLREQISPVYAPVNVVENFHCPCRYVHISIFHKHMS